jgi:hypothetical protein
MTDEGKPLYAAVRVEIVKRLRLLMRNRKKKAASKTLGE